MRLPDGEDLIDIRVLGAADLSQASEVLAVGLCDNPLEVRALGPDRSRRVKALTRLFRALLELPHQQRTGCFENGRLVGVSVASPPGSCRPGLLPSARLGLVVASFGPTAAVRVARWQTAWQRHDPPAPHNHLALLAVHPEARHRGYGQMLLSTYCQGLEKRREVSYLETDRPENVGFYGSHGFSIAAEADVLGVCNWFLLRPAGPRGGEAAPETRGGGVRMWRRSASARTISGGRR